MNRREFLRTSAALGAFSPMLPVRSATGAPTSVPERPNILWLYLEDTSPWMGCYGHPVNKGHTPNIDGLAAGGVRFSRAYVPAPVCSPCRSAMITGAFQCKIGAHEHRSSRAKDAQIQLPQGVELLPAVLKRMGYFTFNQGKTDYSFVWDGKITYDPLPRKKGQKAWPWHGRKPGQPFFGQIQMKGGKNGARGLPEARKAKPDEVTVAPDYPDNDVYRDVFAQHCNTIRKNDDELGKILRQLKAEGLLESTVIVYFSDHGAPGLVRHKQMPTEGGLHVPMIISGPGIPKGDVRDDLVSTLDISATTLAWAGGTVPEYYDGQHLFAAGSKPREFVFSGRDRCDHTLDFVRTVRSDKFRYTRNFLTDRTLLQPQYRDGRDFVKNLRQLYASGQLPEPLIDIYFGERPAEELYDVVGDPHQMKNLARDPAYAVELARHRKALAQWMDTIEDKGRGQESEAAMKYWGVDNRFAKEAVNPEYERVRVDSDGDGLSDLWEKNTKRDPKDGIMHWEFECGGWQTEGWKAVGELPNIAGRQGFLDFDLQKAEAAIERQGLKLDAAKNRKMLAVRLRSSQPLKIRFGWQTSGADPFQSATEWANVPATADFPEATWDLARLKAWSGTVESVRLDFEAPAGTTVEIDSIRVTDGDWDKDGVPDGKEPVGDTDADKIPDALDAK